MFELRDYQKEAVDAAVKYLKGRSKKPGVLVAPTGCGKSILTGKIVKDMGLPALVIQPSKEILEQNVDKARSFGLNPTIYSASCGKKELSELTYATLKSIKKDVNNLKKYGIRLLLLDECHAGYSPEPESEFMKFITKFNDIKVLGLTATPCRLRSYGSLADGNYSKLNILTKDDTVYFENIVHVTQIRELVDKNFWTPLVYERWIFDEQDLKLTTTGSEYTNESIKEAVKRNGLNNSIYMRIMQLLNEREHILVCMDSVESCNIISTFMNKRMGEITGVVTSETPTNKRTNIIKQFKEGRIKVMFNYSSLATGFDFPELDCVIFGRPTFSYAVWYQLCLSMDMEILTKRGFIKYEDMRIDDETASYVNGKIVWSKIKEIIHRPMYDGERMIEFESINTSFRVTEGHDLLVSWNHRKKGYEKEKAIDAMYRKNGFYIPIAGCEDVDDYEGINDCDLELLGYVMSDGYIGKNNQCIISQSETKMDNVKDIERILKECRIKYGVTIQKKIVKFGDREEKEYAPVHMFYFSKNEPKGEENKNLRGWNYLGEFMDKKFNDVYQKLSKRQIEIFLKTLNKGNGDNCRKITWNSHTYNIAMGTNMVFANKLQSLLVRRGYKCTMSVDKNKERTQCILHIKDKTYGFVSGQNTSPSVKNGKITERPKMKFSKTEAGEHVWCVKNTIGTIVTRRNGKVAIMGNCGRCVRISPKKKNALIVDCCDNYRRFGRVEDMSIEKFPGYGWCMFAGDKLISGIRMGVHMTKQMMMERLERLKEKRSGNLGAEIMWFGKYEGIRFDKIPPAYFDFIVNNMDMSQNYRFRKILEYYSTIRLD